jgi:hypothetical protein
MENNYTLNVNDFGSGNIEIKIPVPVADALKNGTILMNASFSKEGVDVWVQYLNGRHPPHKSFSLEEASWEEEFYRPDVPAIAGEPISTAAKKSLPSPSPDSQSPEVGKGKKIVKWAAPSSSDEEEVVSPKTPTQDRTRLVKMSWKHARSHVEDRKLDRHRTNGVLNYYPSDSLVNQDFKRVSIVDFCARVTYVASCIGNPKAVSRIASNSELKVRGATTLSSWWERASVRQRLTLLTQAKKFKGGVDTTRLAQLDCPFGAADLSQDSDNESA